MGANRFSKKSHSLRTNPTNGIPSCHFPEEMPSSSAALGRSESPVWLYRSAIRSVRTDQLALPKTTCAIPTSTFQTVRSCCSRSSRGQHRFGRRTAHRLLRADAQLLDNISLAWRLPSTVTLRVHHSCIGTTVRSPTPDGRQFMPGNRTRRHPTSTAVAESNDHVQQVAPTTSRFSRLTHNEICRPTCTVRRPFPSTTAMPAIPPNLGGRSATSWPNIQPARTLWYHDHGIHHTGETCNRGLARSITCTTAGAGRACPPTIRPYPTADLPVPSTSD